jgi:hypothetical protein
MKRPINKETLIVSAGVAIGLFAIISGFNGGSTGRDAQRLPAAIERMTPAPGDQVLQQSQIFVDFIDGYNASLTIDGIALDTTRLDELTNNGATPRPGAQVDIPPTAIYDPGNFTISFLPQEGAPITTLIQGTHTATVVYWKITDGPEKSRSFTWEFDAD